MIFGVLKHRGASSFLHYRNPDPLRILPPPTYIFPPPDPVTLIGQTPFGVGGGGSWGSGGRIPLVGGSGRKMAKTVYY